MHAQPEPSSFPYFSIARDRGLDYADVLNVVEATHASWAATGQHALSKAQRLAIRKLSRGDMRLILRAVFAEALRQRRVIETAAS